MQHYTATVQCICGHRFTVCVHSPRLVVHGTRFTVVCPVNASRVHVPAKELVAVEACPPGAVVVVDEPKKPRWRFG